MRTVSFREGNDFDPEKKPKPPKGQVIHLPINHHFSRGELLAKLRGCMNLERPGKPAGWDPSQSLDLGIVFGNPTVEMAETLRLRICNFHCPDL